MKTIRLFENRLRILMPEDICQIQESEAVDVFPSNKRPQIIFANAGFSRYLTFNLLDKPLGSEETLNAAREMRKLIWSLYPNALIFKEKPFRFGSFKCSGFSFRTGLNETQKYNTMFAASFEDKLLLGTFGCGMDDNEGKELLRKLIEGAEYTEAKQ